MAKIFTLGEKHWWWNGVGRELFHIMNSSLYYLTYKQSYQGYFGAFYYELEKPKEEWALGVGYGAKWKTCSFSGPKKKNESLNMRIEVCIYRSALWYGWNCKPWWNEIREIEDNACSSNECAVYP